MKSRAHQGWQKRQDGFTVVELMIATMVFSLILTIITTGVISFTLRYYKGVNSSTTQTTARSVLDTISQAIQFGTSTVRPTNHPFDNYFCAGGYSFTVDKGVMYSGSGPGGLYMAPMGGVCGPASTGGKQLLGKNMRVTALSVDLISGTGGAGSLYKISLGIAYGDDDLLCAPTASPGACSGTSNLTSFWRSDILCRSKSGSQFCATSKLTTIVEQRIGT